MCTPTQGVWQPAGCVSCELVCVCVSFVRVVIICPASTHTALVSSPSLTAVLHRKTQHTGPKCQDAQAQTVEKGETATSVRRKRWVPGSECDIHGTGARRGSVEKLLTPSDALRQTVLARAPLAAMVGYASALRSLTAGEASLSMEFSHYAPLDAHTEQQRLLELRGW